MLRGIQIFHNHIRPHMGLDGKTPADAAGIQVKGENVANYHPECESTES